MTADIDRGRYAKRAAGFVPVVPKRFPKRFTGEGFSPAIVSDDLLICSGMVGFSDDGSIPVDLAQQVENTFRNIGDLLTEVGASYANIICLTSYHVGSVEEQLAVVGSIKDRFCTPPHCAWTAVGVTSLAVRDATIEIQAVARIPRMARVEPS